MRADALKLEAGRMEQLTIENYPWFHERHRAFPEVFEGRKHRKIIDLAAGIGIVAKRITEEYDCEMTVNEIDGSCLEQLRRLDVTCKSFDLDTGKRLPLKDGSYDAVLSLVTLEHVIHTENLIEEMYRILTEDGRLYVSVPNYASILHMITLLRGRSFHDPLDPVDRYEFYAHVRYFTYRTLIDLFRSFDLFADTTYVTLPREGARYLRLKERSPLKAFLFRQSARVAYSVSPRFHPGPIVCFSKQERAGRPRIVHI